MCKMLYIVVHVGNSCVMKCSEMAVATSNLLAELIPKYLDQVCVYVNYTRLAVSRVPLIKYGLYNQYG